MKKLIALLLAALMMLSVCGCGGEPEPSETEAFNANDFVTDTFCMGFAEVDITPKEATPLGGYGVSKFRISEEVGYPLKLTAMALTGSNGQTLLVIEGDIITMSSKWGADVITRICYATGLAEDQIYMGASHTHCFPDTTAQDEYPAVARYMRDLYEKFVEVSVAALKDRKPCEVSFGQAETEGLNFVRHYTNTNPDGSLVYFGDNYGQFVEEDKTTEHMREPNRTLHIVKFAREGEKDLLLCNFRAHPAFHGASSKKIVSADYIGAYREAVQSALDCDFMYMQGACGDVNPKSRKPGEAYVSKAEEYAARLLEYTQEALQDMTPVDGTTLQTKRAELPVTVDHAEDHLFLIAKDIQTVWNTNRNIEEVMAMAEPYGISSPFHANAIATKYNMGESGTVKIGSFTIGENLGIAVAPFEVFTELGNYIEQNAPQEKVIIMGYAYPHVSYLPAASAFEYNAYEADCFKYLPGTGEMVSEELVSLLSQLNSAE